MADIHRIAVISPFVDKRHGTERCVAEQIERLARDYNYHIDLYSQRVEDLVLSTEADGSQRATGGQIIWHRVPSIPGPHLLKYIWWFVANMLYRTWDRLTGKVVYDLLYSPGINCLNADIVVVYHVFIEFAQRIRDGAQLKWRSPIAALRVIHRRMYYRLIISLERVIYGNTRTPLIAITGTVAHLLKQHFNRSVTVSYIGIDTDYFNPLARQGDRQEARRKFNVTDSEIALLVVGNDWHEKGLPIILEAMCLLGELSLVLLVRGNDDRRRFDPLISKLGLERKVRILDRAQDMVQFYAAADLYASPSLYDSYAMPAAEAMACGLPVIVSRQAGVSEIVTHGVDGFILNDPRNAQELAGFIRQLHDAPELRKQLGEQAAETARQYTWDRHAAELHQLFQAALTQKWKP